jgi:hypothetical protein
MKRFLPILLSYCGVACASDFLVGTYSQYVYRPEHQSQLGNTFAPILGDETFNVLNAEYSAHQGFADIYLSSGVSYLTQEQWPFDGSERSNVNTARTYVSEAYTQTQISDYVIALGRKKVRWGVAYVLSPTDLVSQGAQPSDPENDAYSMSGSDLLGTSVTLGDSSILDFYYLPDDARNKAILRDQALAFRWYKFLSPFDISIVGRLEDSHQKSLGANTAVAIGDSLELHGEILWSSDNFQSYPSQIATGHLFERRKNEVYKALAGGQWSPVEKWNVVLEYLYISNGYSKDDWNNLNNWSLGGLGDVEESDMQAIKNFEHQVTKRKNYIFARSLSKDFLGLMDVELISFIGTNDNSSLNRISLVRRVFTSAEVFARYSFVSGGSNSEFGKAVNVDNVYNVGFKFKFN